MTKTRNRYDHEFKIEAIKLVLEQQRKIPEVASSLNIGKSTLEKWIKQYKDELHGKAPTTGKALTDDQRRIQQLEKEVRQLRAERDILKKASALLALDTLSVHR